jgi:putative ABC transport system permease protein
MGTLTQDLIFCLRTLRKTPGFTVIVILTLALGIGANTAIFSIVDGVLLRPLPFPDPERLVKIADSAPGAGLYDFGTSEPELRDLQGRRDIFDGVSAIWPVSADATGGTQPERIELVVVSPNYFSLLGVHAQIGRIFGPQDQAEGFADPVLISNAFWRRAFGSDPNVLGRRIKLDGDASTIVGVMPEGFRHPGKTIATDTDIWATAGFAADPFTKPPRRDEHQIIGLIGRLRPGLTVAAAQARLDSFTAQLRAQYPNDYKPGAGFSIQLEPLKDSLTGNLRPLLLTLMGAVGMMLLIGCANVANLLLVRSAGRQREMALRQSLGASRARLVRQMLTESLVLAFAAGVVGFATAAWSLGLLLYLVPSNIPRLTEITINPRVLIFSLGVSVLTGVLFGLAPAFQFSCFDLATYLKESARGASSSRRQNRVSFVLVAGEFAICLILMTGAGLLARSFWELMETNPGFNPQNAMVAHIWLPAPDDPRQDVYTQKQRTPFVREVLRRVRELPGISSAAMSTAVPLSQGGTPIPISVEGLAGRVGDATLADVIGVSPDYFAALGAPLVSGRLFTESDQRGSQEVALVDLATAARYWPGESALGKRVKIGTVQSTPHLQTESPWATVVGVVGNIRHDAIETSGVPHIYYSIYQFSNRTLNLLVRSASDPAPLGESMRREVQAVDPNLPVFGISTFSNVVESSLAPHRFSAQLMGAFAALALLLAAVGIYGVLAYFVGQRVREIGVRMALGASAGEVVRLVLLRGMYPIIAGTALGLVGSFACSRLLAQLLYGVSMSDPLVYLAVPAFLLFTALLASYIPARRATRIDPLAALRCD